MVKRILYLDPFSGISGDMFLASLLDLGLDLAHLKRELAKLGVGGYELKSSKTLRGVMAATHFEVIVSHDPAAHSHEPKPEPAHSHSHAHSHAHDHSHSHSPSHAHSHEPAHSHTHHENHGHGHDAHQHHDDHAHVHRPFKEIRKLIDAAALSPRVKAQSLRAFELLAEVEGRMHGQTAEDVQFHEVGGLDSIVDFVGVCIGLEALGVDEVCCGPLALGGDGALGGYVQCAHGKLPVPAFATLELAKGLPLRHAGVDKELTTPTGAALIQALVKPEHRGPLPNMQVERIGYGAGARNDPKIPIPNVLRAVLGTRASSETASAAAPATIVELQANLDDVSGETLGYAAEKLLAAGALDVFFVPVQMKKGRPGTLLTVLAAPDRQADLLNVLFRETTTFGVRYELKSRAVLERETVTVATAWGEVRVKLGRWQGAAVSAHPEFEDCRKLAERHGVPLRAVQDAARAAAAGL